MSGLDKLKENKKLIIIAAGAVVIVVALIVFVLPNLGQKEEGPQPEVVSKRVRIDLQPQAAPGAPQPAATTAAPAPAAKPGETKPAVKAAAGPAMKETAPKPVEAAKAETEKKPAKSRKALEAQVSSKPWAINISSFITGNEAQAFRKKLKASGYKAYVSKFEKDDMTWYRVRVGFYRTQAEAKQAGKKIAAKFKIDHEPWILKPAKAEMAKYAK
ncbi:MAG: SPOR domain-containing protein [Deltaproteobacteria bacterium]|nr:SPOR domain-containing protein [Deltaproteobacteria bacterium]